MSKVIVKIDIPTDYADEYKQWIIEGRLCYLEDNAWTHLKDVECKVEPYREAIPIEWVEKFRNQFDEADDFYDLLNTMLTIWKRCKEESE